MTIAKLCTTRTAFFLCDIQERFRPLIYKFPDVIRTADKMLKASKILDVPLIVTEQYPKSLGKTVQELDVTHAKLHVPKTRFSMCTPDVENFIKKSSIENVVLFGIESHVCVTQTAIELLDKGVHVHVLADGVSSANSMEIPIALQRLRTSGATITSSEGLLFQLLKDSSHEKFKEVSSLVKEFSQATQENELFKFVAHKL